MNKKKLRTETETEYTLQSILTENRFTEDDMMYIKELDVIVNIENKDPNNRLIDVYQNPEYFSFDIPISYQRIKTKEEQIDIIEKAKQYYNSALKNKKEKQ